MLVSFIAFLNSQDNPGVWHHDSITNSELLLKEITQATIALHTMPRNTFQSFPKVTLSNYLMKDVHKLRPTAMSKSRYRRSTSNKYYCPEIKVRVLIY